VFDSTLIDTVSEPFVDVFVDTVADPASAYDRGHRGDEGEP
jgi:hypothetical protein